MKATSTLDHAQNVYLTLDSLRLHRLVLCHHCFHVKFSSLLLEQFVVFRTNHLTASLTKFCFRFSLCRAFRDDSPRYRTDIAHSGLDNMLTELGQGQAQGNRIIMTGSF